MDTIEMTAAELKRLQDELNELETDGRSQIASRIKTAREWGDLKENASITRPRRRRRTLRPGFSGCASRCARPSSSRKRRATTFATAARST